jgi:hypothetical protein
MPTGHTDPPTGPDNTGARAVQRAERGDHLCAFHGTDDERRRLATAFVRSALGAGDRVLYIAQERGADGAAAVLEESADSPVDSGQFVVLDFAAVYGSPAAPDLDEALARLLQEAERSRTDGYPGLRVAMEMGDFVDVMPSLDAVTSWEETVTRAFADVGIIGLCQYDEHRVDPATQARIAAAHPAVAADDGTVPRATFRPTEEPWGLAVAGELDVSNTGAFAGALQARAVAGRRLHLDLGDLRFTDVAAVRAVFRTAGELPESCAVVLRRVPGHMHRLLGLLEWTHPRVEVEES